MDNFYTESSPDPEQPGQQVRQNSFRRFLFDLLETLTISLVLFFMINAVSARIRVQMVSMQPTLFEGDFVLVNRLAYKFGSPSTGDIVIFRVPNNPESEPYIKRIIGTPGDTVQVAQGKVYKNGILLDEPYLASPPVYSGSWSVPDGNLFVLGDNRNNSSDSHNWGMVPLENVIGKAELVYFPISRWKSLNPRAALAAGPDTGQTPGAYP